MPNHAQGKDRTAQATEAQPGVPTFKEPEMRRWPHPVEERVVSEMRQSGAITQTDTALYYIHCALSYQNQLLADIKSLLERLTVESARDSEKK